MDPILDLAQRIGETGAPQIVQIRKLHRLFGPDWIAAREREAATSTVPSVLFTKAGTPRTPGAKFFRCCRRTAWKAYQAGILTLAGLGWLFDPTDAEPSEHPAGDGERRSRRSAEAKARRRARRKANRPPPPPPTKPRRRPSAVPNTAMFHGDTTHTYRQVRPVEVIVRRPLPGKSEAGDAPAKNDR